VKVLLTWQADPEEKAKFQTALPDVQIHAPPATPSFSRFDCTLDAIGPFVAEADVIVGWVLPPGALQCASKLKLLCWMHAGCDELDFASLKAMNVQLTNIRGANSTAVAEHAIALLLGSAKRLMPARQALVEAQPSPYYVPGQHSAMLDNRKVGIIGFGSIGTEIARRLKPFNMEVIAVRRHPQRRSAWADAIYGVESLHHVLAHSDYVVLAAPMTRDTEGMLGVAEFDAMKPGAFLINIARGNLVQELPLHAALKSGKLAGYAADVWWFYANAYPATYHFPSPSRTGLHRLSNVLGTGGQASNAADVVARSIDRALESLVEFANGRPLSWAVDLDLGY
jgi:phosphoglycerate dehydrogenase-like enzyme